MRRRPRGRNIYTVDYLLEKQAKALQKHPRYGEMLLSLVTHPGIRQKRFNRRCYSLLHNAVIRPEHLENFYRTYRLPRHPFIPLFFQIKRHYLRDREQKKLDRQQYIAEKINDLPEHVYDYFKSLALLEQKYSSSGRAVYFQLSGYPRSKRKIDQYLKFNREQWIDFFDIFWKGLLNKYPRLTKRKRDQMQAAFILGCPVNNERGLSESMIKERYRQLCKIYHPDAGGSSVMFNRIKWARDILLQES